MFILNFIFSIIKFFFKMIAYSFLSIFIFFIIIIGAVAYIFKDETLIIIDEIHRSIGPAIPI
ncbi:MAG: hypothetical protein CM15mP93_05100 [Thiotrichaceae bacterium]|jgi:hypothetical protein|nr:hypothetical protein [Hyphomicrobiales bacterium]MAR81382.1 hypothetical protein [Gammaproteobacteria bacterium]GIR92323.1 MAG: hypothetical protein CM15mP93_05100 [Thiotrichaceae bacterium]|tara:strand:+ start:139 stop:324 length:186 start_codon:yes stop_codon:yes gene_type:complete